MNALIERIRRDGARLNQEVMAGFYRDPFWRERFGTRGEKHSQEDGLYHLSFLAEALAAGDPGILTRYATWLRTVLVTRGMCSRHLAQNFARLAGAIAGWPGGENAVHYLRLAEASLRYGEGPARELLGSVDALVDATCARAEVPPERWRDELCTLLSYLADALASDRPDLLAAHLRWYLPFRERQGISADESRRVLAALERSLAGLAPAARLLQMARNGG